MDLKLDDSPGQIRPVDAAPPGFVSRLHSINTDRVVSVALTADNFAMETNEDPGTKSGEGGGDAASDDDIEPGYIWLGFEDEQICSIGYGWSWVQLTGSNCPS